MNIPASTNHTGKINESEKIYWYLEDARDLKMLWNIKVIVILIADGVVRTVPKGLEKRLERLEKESRLSRPLYC